MTPENIDRQNHYCGEDQSDERNRKSSRKLGEVELLLLDGEPGFLEMCCANRTRFGLLLTAGESGAQGKSREQLGWGRRRRFRQPSPISSFVSRMTSPAIERARAA